MMCDHRSSLKYSKSAGFTGAAINKNNSTVAHATMFNCDFAILSIECNIMKAIQNHTRESHCQAIQKNMKFKNVDEIFNCSKSDISE